MTHTHLMPVKQFQLVTATIAEYKYTRTIGIQLQCFLYLQGDTVNLFAKIYRLGTEVDTTLTVKIKHLIGRLPLTIDQSTQRTGYSGS